MLADPRSKALVDNFAAQWLFLRNLQSFVPDSDEFPELGRQPAPGDAAGNEPVLREHHARGPERPGSADGRLHVPQRAAGTALRHPEGVRQPVPPRDALPTKTAAACSGQGSVLAVTSYPNRTSPVLRGKYILENILGTPPPSPPANVPPLKETGEDGQALSLKALHGAAPVEPGVRDLPSRHGSAGLLAREFRRHGQVAPEGSRRRRRCLGAARRRHAGGRSGGAAQGHPEAPRAVRPHDDREDADVRARTRPRVLRLPTVRVDRARCRRRRTTASRRSCSASSGARRFR